MKHSIVLKFLAILVAACTLVLALGSIGCLVALESRGLYTEDLETRLGEYMAIKAENAAQDIANRYAVMNLSNCPREMLMNLGYWYITEETYAWLELDEDQYSYRLTDDSGKLLEQVQVPLEDPYIFEFTTMGEYPWQVEYPEEGKGYWVEYNGQTVQIQQYQSPVYTVTISVTPGALTDYNGLSMALLHYVYDMRYAFTGILAACLLVFVICMVYLCCAAGKTYRRSPVNPGGLNRLPLDLYAAVAVVGCFFVAAISVNLLNDLLYANGSFSIVTLVLIALVLLAGATLGIGFVFALAAQMKMKDLYWWHHSAIGWCCGKLWMGMKLLTKVAKHMFELLPLIWQYVLIGAVMGIAVIVATGIWVVEDTVLLLVAVVLCCIALVCYGAYCHGLLLDGSERMARGNLNVKISTKYLTGTYSRCAENLNALADVATVAAKNQLKSDRMKTELITNVSHDIKTPLTSIINYVDLLQKPHTEQEEIQYLEVLGRQSQRMKKLIEDLMEMSKATTGDMTVELTRVDAAEAVNQALGEFSDKLAAAQLTPVFRQPEEPVAIRADGRLTWRVLSNLLSNTVKYALPGTRMYIDLMRLDGQAVISLKNISRDPLNISADELTERFVRGDASRNSEGSGLGLNIAKSLMELQKGQLQLLVDGDLFKVTLIFPAE